MARRNFAPDSAKNAPLGRVIAGAGQLFVDANRDAQAKQRIGGSCRESAFWRADTGVIAGFEPNS